MFVSLSVQAACEKVCRFERRFRLASWTVCAMSRQKRLNDGVLLARAMSSSRQKRLSFLKHVEEKIKGYRLRTEPFGISSRDTL